MNRSPRLALLLAAAAALAGCGPGSRPVVRVADRTATVDDFERAASVSNPMSPEGVQAPGAILDGLVRDELLLVAAHQHGLDTTAAYRRLRDATRERLLLRSYSGAVAPNDIGVSEAEARTWWSLRQVQYDVAIVYSTDAGMIAQARAALDRGEPFASVADHFNAIGTVPPGGELGLVQLGQLGPPLDDWLRALPVGTVGGPYSTPQGHFLLRVNRRVPVPPVAFEAERSALIENLRQLKQRQALSGALIGLEHERDLVIAPDADIAVYQLLIQQRVGDAPAPNPGAAERAQVLAHWQGGAYTLGDAFDELKRGDVRAPNACATPAIHAWIESRAITRMGIDEARRRHLDEEPAYVHGLRDELDRFLLENESSNAMVGVAALPDTAAEAMWNSVKAQYVQVLEAHLRWIETADTTVASAIARRVGSGEAMAAAAHAVSPGLVVHDEVKRFPVTDPQWAAIVGGAARMQPGELRGPETSGGGVWRLIQLVDKRQGVLDWAQLTPEMQMSVRGSGMQQARAQRFGAYVDSLRRALNPVVLAQNLKGMPWPPPGPLEP